LVVDYVARRTQTKMVNKGAKKKRLHGIPKLDDANKAGGPQSLECTLILTEGDSAKSTAIAGLSVVGRDTFGVFPLKGKLLNVRDASLAQRSKNAEITNLGKIMGITGVQPQDVSKLRYGSIVIMADQDVDGSHIKGLVLNWLDVYAPSLLRRPGFVRIFQTPIVRCTKRHQEPLEMFSVPEYEQWKTSTPDHATWKQKYFKGLGTSTAADAKRYFGHLDKYVIPWTYVQGQEGSLDLAFRRARASDRRQWLSHPAADAGLVTPTDAVQFVDKELVLFGLASVARAVPSVWDGLKPSQRKVLFTCLKRNLKDEIKVAQLSGSTSELTAYHHGEASLNGTIIKMAQNHMGSNNMHLLKPSGQFGTRLMGGSDHASPRYIFTELTDDTRRVFREEDDAILTYREEDGLSIEPRHYAPVLPWVLVNGAQGIATGYSTFIPSYNPQQLAQTLCAWLEHHSPFATRPLTPWVRGFTGTVAPVDGGFEFVGIVRRASNTRAIVTELPPGLWTQNFKDWLGRQAWFTRLEEKSTDTTVHIVVHTNKPLPNTDLETHFKLRKKVSLNSLVLFDTKHKLRHYANVYDILEEWAPARLAHYSQRLQHQVADVQRSMAQAQRRQLWVEWVLTNNVSQLEKNAIEQALESLGLMAPFNDLLDMPMRSLTRDAIQRLTQQQQRLQATLDALRETTPVQVWLQELQEFQNKKRKRQ
jgi:DNA topoisomerase-2